MASLDLIKKIAGMSLSAIRRQNANLSVIQGLLNTFEAAYSAKVKHTVVGGIAVKLTNKTGAASIKGYLVDASPDHDSAVKLVAIGVPDCIGVFLDSDVADGDEAWIVVGGIAEVYFSGSTTRNHMARIGFSNDTGEQAGQAISEEFPTSPFATDKHFAEIGHVLESRTWAGLAKVLTHHN